jgi:predicted methyltransferase
MKTLTLPALAGLTMMFGACGNGGGETKAAPETASAAPPAAEQTETPAPAPRAPSAAEGTIAAAVAGDWRPPEDTARDAHRHPVETLEFFGIANDDTVVELWPGSGWYTRILAPYLASGGGKLILAGFDPSAFEGERRARIEERNAAFREAFEDETLYGDLVFTRFSEGSPALAPPESVDAVLTFRNMHNWMRGGYADKAFDDAYAALKPGGTLAIVEHRLASTREQDPAARSGYVHEDFVKSAAARAGFEFVATSEINANPKDTADHPFGVWTLPPTLRTEDGDGNTPEGFDPAAYEAIGESDRMTLKFVKPPETDDT